MIAGFVEFDRVASVVGLSGDARGAHDDLLFVCFWRGLRSDNGSAFVAFDDAHVGSSAAMLGGS